MLMEWKVYKSALFKRQWRDFALYYKAEAGQVVAERFVDAVEEALNFISTMPLACSKYQPASESLLKYEFRKWRLKGFPYTIFFKVTKDKTIMIEAIYGQHMDIENRIQNDIE